MVKSISDAIDEVVEDDIQDDESTDATDETTSEETEETEGTLLDEEDEDEEEVDEAPDRTRDDAVEGGDTEEDDEPDAADIFDQLTPDQLAEIKSNPALNKLRKSLMRDYSTKTTEHAQLVQLGNAYRQDPQGVLRAIAQQLGMQVTPAQQIAAQQQAEADPGKELEELFGEQIGPKVRAVFDKWAEARLGARLSTEVAPLRDALGRVVSQGEAVRMQGEEATFKARHKEITPQVEADIVALGNSGKIVPGNMSPQEYLDTLYDVVTARRSRQASRQQTGQASTKLARKIEANRRDREPSGQTGRGGVVKPVSKIGKARNISEALDFAMAELESEERR